MQPRLETIHRTAPQYFPLACVGPAVEPPKVWDLLYTRTYTFHSSMGCIQQEWRSGLAGHHQRATGSQIAPPRGEPRPQVDQFAGVRVRLSIDAAPPCDAEHAFLDASIAQRASELPIFKKRLEVEERINKAPKRKRSVGTTSTADASVSKSDELLDCVVCDDDKRDPQTSTSGSTLTDTDRMPARKRHVCAQSGCSTFARRQSAGSTCYAHGSGGKRCKVPDCGKCAQSGTDACVAHGGGKHCEEPDCLKSAVGGTGACVAHGLFLVVTPPGESLSRRESFR